MLTFIKIFINLKGILTISVFVLIAQIFLYLHYLDFSIFCHAFFWYSFIIFILYFRLHINKSLKRNKNIV